MLGGLLAGLLGQVKGVVGEGFGGVMVVLSSGSESAGGGLLGVVLGVVKGVLKGLVG